MAQPSLIPKSAEPKVRRPKVAGLLLAVFPASTALYALFNGVQSIVLPAQVQAFDPENKIGNLAILSAVVALVAMVGSPIGGAVSDRTRSRFGRRSPWLAATSIAAAILTIAMNFAANLVVLTVIMSALWLVANIYGGALVAVMPDRVPEQRRGLASAVLGISTPVGVIVGVNIASQSSQVVSYTIFAVALVVTTAIFLVGAREKSSMNLPRPPRVTFSLRGLTTGTMAFFSAFRNRDFTLAFASRFFLFLSYFTVSGYAFFVFQDYIGLEQIPGGDAATAVSTSLSLSIVAWVAVAAITGPLADKLGRRKLFVGVSAIGLAGSLVIPLIWPTWTGMIVYSLCIGAAIGTYFAVDLAVMTKVLPNPETAGRDFGILNAATGMPIVLSPLIAAGLISFLGGYPALFVFGMVAAVVAGILMFRIRSLR
ncbi:MFS transporter [Clavibacter michiganensis subsp. michiganensis]|uniref:MFS transporter n=1 Tax=Clavibacter michiganensis TaxID=28447 RepID=UPI000A3B6335|nr:MFS transporter [Clavibacter michiganensis]MDO4099305.1 MFS transporter [Clavibacter michiganensis]OUE26511.1 Major Facilitator Superfamily protein [Clavibacter michiganensis subsp. michiganensis]QXP04641.1 MFS transporter [Clavibacter michiganensis subsp. michiganensis]